MTITTRGNLPTAVGPYLAVMAKQEIAKRAVTEEWSKVYTKGNPIEKNQHITTILAGFGVAPQKFEGAAMLSDSVRQQYNNIANYETYALMAAVTQETIEDGRVLEVMPTMAAGLVKAMNEARELSATNLLNNAFTSYSAGDGAPLISSSHQTDGTPSNVLATPAALSEASLEALTNQIYDFANHRGVREHLNVKKLVVPTALRFTAQKILSSTLTPGSANNAINALVDLKAIPDGIQVMRRLSSPTAYYLTTDADNGLTFLERTPFDRAMDTDFQSGNQMIRVRGRWVFTCPYWPGVWGSTGV